MNVIDAKHIKVLSIVKKTLLFSIFMIILVSPSAAQDSLIILNSSDVPTMLQNVKFIESFGGTITHKFPPHVLIGDIPASQRTNLIGRMNIVEIAIKPVDVLSVSEYGRTAEIAVDVWNNNYMGLAAEQGIVSITGAPEPGPIVGDMLIVPEDAKQSEKLTNEIPVQTLPYGAGFYDTSEYMIGDVAVGIVFLESNGSIDESTEDWTTDEESNVVSEIQAGLNWWAERETNAKLTFTYDIHYKVPTPYEPITRSGPTGSPIGESLWITNAMTNLGYTNSPYYFNNVYDYNNAIRRSLNTDWAFTIFVVDSSKDVDGYFTDNYFAYAYLGGPFMVMTYKNDGYGIANMDAVTAHENGHIFYALDQYASANSSCTKTSGYLAIENQNSAYPYEGACLSNVSSIMRGQVAPYTSGAIDTYARRQIGWRDTDVDGILDIIDFLPTSTLNAYLPDPTNDNTPTYTGRSTTTTTYPNMNPYSHRNDITINKIASVQYRVNSSVWIDAAPADGLFNSSIEDFTFTIPQLPDGTHTIDVRARNTGGNWETTYSSDSLTIDATPPAISFVSPPTPANNSFLTLNYVNVSVISNENLISPKLEWNGTNESIGGSELSWYKNKIGLSDGNYSFRIWGNDLVNNWNVTQSRTVTVDTRPPIVAANPTVYPANQNAARNGSLITLNATITDLGTGVKNATVSASQINSSLGDVILNNISGFYTNSTVIVNTSDGTYRLNITAYDNAGNKNDSVQISVIVDNTPPNNITINPVSYQRGSAANNLSIIGFNVSASDNLAGLKNASINASLINNTGIIEITNRSGFWKGNATFDNYTSDGNYSLNVTFFDYAGNLNDSAQINIKIDNNPPSVTDVNVSSRFINVTGFVNITADITSGDTRSIVNESEVFARITYPNGTSINYNMSGGGTFYRNFTDTAQYGRFNVTILANDTTGNTNSTQKTHFVTTLITNISVTTNASNETVISAPFSNTTLRLFTNNTSNGSINITLSKVNITSNELTNNPGIYVLIDISDSKKTNLSYMVISVNYTDAEVSSLVENSLRLHRWNTTTPKWDKLSGAGSPLYVNNAGVDTNNNFVWANMTKLCEFGVSGDLYVPPAEQYISSGGGGGGGGGGGPSGENYTNIEVKENYDLHIFKDKVTSYRYTNRSNPVMFVNITGNINAGEINAAVEVLRNTSTLIKPQTPAQGIVYKNVNIWVGTTGFAVQKNIKIAAIKFKVL
jgi:hypothetical protein